MVLHEQNTVPGLTNRIASRFAREVHITYSASRCHFPRRGHLRLSGVPLRDGIMQGSRGKALRLFRLEDDRQDDPGVRREPRRPQAQRSRRRCSSALCGPRGCPVRDPSGAEGSRLDARPLSRGAVRTWVRPFILNMGDAYAIADLVVCRAGALTLAELAGTGRPAILVPYPYATANHQTLNAEIPVDAGAAVLVPDDELTGEVLASKIIELLDEPRRLRMMSIQSMKLSRADATDRIVGAIRRIGEGLVPNRRRRCMSTRLRTRTADLAPISRGRTMSPTRIRRIHFVGIGGTGMCGLAEVCLNLGYQVTGQRSGPQRRHRAPRETRRPGRSRTSGGAGRGRGPGRRLLRDPANESRVPRGRAGSSIPMLKRGEMLAEIMRLKTGIAIAGAHGKTTTTSLTGHVLSSAGLDPTVVVGGRLRAVGSNARLGRGGVSRGRGRRERWLVPRPEPDDLGGHQHRPRAPRPLQGAARHPGGIPPASCARCPSTGPRSSAGTTRTYVK